MATKPKTQKIVTMAANADDLKMIDFLCRKLGMNPTGALRYSLRRTVEQEKQSAAQPA